MITNKEEIEKHMWSVQPFCCFKGPVWPFVQLALYMVNKGKRILSAPIGGDISEYECFRQVIDM